MENITEISEKTKNAVSKRYGNSFTFLHHTGGMFGIGCAYDDEAAVERIIEYKGKSSATLFILLVPDFRAEDGFSLPALKRFLGIDLQADSGCAMLLDQYWPGNLTVCFDIKDKAHIYPKAYKRYLSSGRIALRCPSDKLLRNFIKCLRKPVLSTSINKTGQDPLNDIKKIKQLDWFDFSVLNAKLTKDIDDEPKPSTIIAADKGVFECIREGMIPCKQIQQSYRKPLITFICTGNICRSPMAEFYARDKIEQKGLPLRTASAGVFASGYSISSNSETALKEDNIESADHVSMQVDYDLISRSYIVLAMEEVHKHVIYNMFPDMRHKVFTIADYCGTDKDVSDPFTKDRSVYDDTYNLIKRYVDIIVEKLEKKSKGII